MSLYLQEQKLGSHSQSDSSSHKFMLKGRQTGGMHRGHGWVFRAESRDTMFAWYNDIKSLTEKTGIEREAYVRRHARSISQGSSIGAGSASSDGGLEEDEADQVPFSIAASQGDGLNSLNVPERPKPGGRFPSDVDVQRGLRAPRPSSSITSSISHEALAAAGALPGSGVPFGESGHTVKPHEDEVRSGGHHVEHRNNNLPLQSKDSEYEPGHDRIDVVPRQSHPTPTQYTEGANANEPEVHTATHIPQEFPPPSELSARHPDHVVGLDKASDRAIMAVPVTLSDVISESAGPPLPPPMGVPPPTISHESTRATANHIPSDPATQVSAITGSTAGVSFDEKLFPALPPMNQTGILNVRELHVPGEFL